MNLVTHRYIVLFGQTDGWWAKYLPGYTHVCLMEIVGDDYVIVVDPSMHGVSMGIRWLPDKEEANYEMLYVRVRARKKNRLIGFRFQTCATVVQYLMNTDLGAITAQGLYKRLTGCSPGWLRKRGIIGVRQWELKRAQQSA